MSILTVTAGATVRLSEADKKILRIGEDESYFRKWDGRLAVEDVAMSAFEDEWQEVFGKGVSEVGEGMYAVVYDHPTEQDKVVKVTYHEDKCWDHFMKVASRLPPVLKAYVPKRHGWVEYDYHSTYIMERLLPLTMDRVKKSYEMDPRPWHILEDSEFSGLSVRVSRFVRSQDRPRPNPRHHFHRLIKELLKRCSLDVHDANIMFRRNGEMVLNDPVA